MGYIRLSLLPILSSFMTRWFIGLLPTYTGARHLSTPEMPIFQLRYEDDEIYERQLVIEALLVAQINLLHIILMLSIGLAVWEESMR